MKRSQRSGRAWSSFCGKPLHMFQKSILNLAKVSLIRLPLDQRVPAPKADRERRMLADRSTRFCMRRPKLPLTIQRGESDASAPFKKNSSISLLKFYERRAANTADNM